MTVDNRRQHHDDDIDDDNPPVKNIVMPKPDNNRRRQLQQQSQPIVDSTFHRAVHKVRLDAIAHNYCEVESAANRQRCSVIVVVKADGYGHGAIPTAIYLADTIGADAFAVATLEEGIALRKALQQTASMSLGGGTASFQPQQQQTDVQLLNKLGNIQGHTSTNGTSINNVAILHRRQSSNDQNFNNNDWMSSVGGDNVSLMFAPPSLGLGGGRSSGTRQHRRKSLRQAHVRILVLGPPVGFPRCFDDYYHHNIEVMISGPEVATALLEWVVNKNERMRKQVERAAAEAKELILSEQHHHPPANPSNPTATPNPVAPPGAAISKPKLESVDSNLSNKQRGDAELACPSHCAVGDNISTTSSTRSGQSSSGNNNYNCNQQYHPPSATLSNVTGSDLAKEVREILRNQQKLAATAAVAAAQGETQHHQQHVPISRRSSESGNAPLHPTTTAAVAASSSTVTSGSVSTGQEQQLKETTEMMNSTTTTSTAETSMTTTTTLPSSVACHVTSSAPSSAPAVQVFAGIEEAAKYSRTRQKAITSCVFHEQGDDENDDCGDFVPTTTSSRKNSTVSSSDNSFADPTNPAAATKATSVPMRSRIPTNTNRNALPLIGPPKKRLRWHAIVDSGMGRLGFRTDPVSKEDQGKRRDSVEIIKELVDLEVTLDCPIEFYGMCTHMADANSTSNYTHSQINKFKSLLKRVRAAGISVPTISTDNSAALLTTTLTHFEPKELLTQADADSRGFVRTGGAIYGQRPTFPQLRAVSTLMASVRHVAILKEGESVGYDRAYVASMNVRIATLTIGFADGYPRELGNSVGKVSIRGHLFPVAGNVCMDMLMVELGPAGDKHGAGAQVIVGDTAILWGPDDDEEGEGHVPLKDLAATLKTTQSALTCGLNKERVLRRYC